MLLWKRLGHHAFSIVLVELQSSKAVSKLDLDERLQKNTQNEKKGHQETIK